MKQVMQELLDHSSQWLLKLSELSLFWCLLSLSNLKWENPHKFVITSAILMTDPLKSYLLTIDLVRFLLATLMKRTVLTHISVNSIILTLSMISVVQE